MNATIEPDCEQFSLKRYYNIGLAIDTKAGLVVPNIKDTDQKSIFHIAEEIMDLVERAQDRRLDLAELQGGTFTDHQLRGHRRALRDAGDQLPRGGHPGDGPGARDAGGAAGRGGHPP